MLVANLPHFTQWALSCTNTDGIQICTVLRSRHEKTCLFLARNRLQFTPRCKILEPRRFVVSQQDAVSVSHKHMLLLHLKAPLTWLLWYEDIPCTVWRIAAFSSVFSYYRFSLVLCGLFSHFSPFSNFSPFVESYILNIIGIMPVWV